MIIDKIKQLCFPDYLYSSFQLYSTNQIFLCSRNIYIFLFFFSTEGREGLDAALLPGKVEGVDGLVGLYQAGGGPAQTCAGGGGRVRGKRELSHLGFC